MRTPKILLIAIFFTQNAFAAEQKTIKADINEVTVFLNRAQVNSNARTHIESGNSEIVLDGLPAGLDPHSIQISGKGDFIIMSVKHAINYLDQHKRTNEVLALEDSIQQAQWKMEEYKNLKDVLIREEQMILANQSIKGQGNITAAELKAMADFYRTRLTEIKTALMKIEINLKKAAEKSNLFQMQISTVNSLKSQPSSKVTVAVSAKNRTSVSLDLQYVVSNAGWHPIYDIRTKDTKSPVQLNYRAEVYQNTGVNWDKVKIKLSTANPSQSGTKPQLVSWYLNIYDPAIYAAKKKYRYDLSQGSLSKSTPGAISAEAVRAEAAPAESLSDYTKVVETTLAAEFDISLPYSIPSNGQPQLVEVQAYELPAVYKHYAAPKLDKDAFLVAQITQWEKLNILPGNANIYFEGTYVGQSYIDVENTNDTLGFSLGRDRKLVMERKSLKDFTSKHLIGANKTNEYAYEIVVRNTKKDPADLTIEDQIPVSNNSEIEVTLLEGSGAEYNKETGILTWKLKLNPSETKRIVFKYEVKYPKGKSVAGL